MTSDWKLNLPFCTNFRKSNSLSCKPYLPYILHYKVKHHAVLIKNKKILKYIRFAVTLPIAWYFSHKPFYIYNLMFHEIACSRHLKVHIAS